jgi:FkbM family methyltransferase
LSAGIEACLGRRLVNRVCGYFYFRSRGENLYDSRRNGEYRIVEILVQRALGPAPVAIDAGANVGDWSKFFLGRAAAGRVFAFEPVAGTFRELRKRIGAAPGAECVNAALSDKSGRCEMHVGPLAGSNSIYVVPGEVSTGVETVSTITGDEFLAQRGPARVDFLKIDVEGHEVSVLRGFRQAIAGRRLRFIQWEYNKTWIPARTSLADVFALLEPAGYRLCKLRRNDVLHYARYDRALDSYCYSNWLAVAEEDFALFQAQVRVVQDTASDG